jgi:outer membrane protein, multidrug efflux system
MGIGPTQLAGIHRSLSAGITQILSGSLDASWELDLFGKFAFSQQAEQARLAAEELTWQNAKVSLAVEVASDYVSYRACELSVVAYQHAITSKQDTARCAVRGSFS